MTRDITLPAAGPSETMVFEGEGWFDPLEDAVRGKVRTFIEAILEEELEASLLRKRYERHGDGQAIALVGRNDAALPLRASRPPPPRGGRRRPNRHRPERARERALRGGLAAPAKPRR